MFGTKFAVNLTEEQAHSIKRNLEIGGGKQEIGGRQFG